MEASDVDKDQSVVTDSMEILEGNVPLTEFQDEMHLPCLSFMEVSKVKQLRYDEIFTSSMSGRENLTDKNDLRSSGSSYYTSGQFKVFQRGHWTKLNFERNRALTQIKYSTSESHRTLHTNPWIQHFRSNSSDKKQISPANHQQKNYFRNGQKISKRQPTNDIPLTSHLAYQKLVIKTIQEGCDQNLVCDNSKEQEDSSIVFPKKRTRTDQVVPFVKSSGKVIKLK